MSKEQMVFASVFALVFGVMWIYSASRRRAGDEVKEKHDCDAAPTSPLHAPASEGDKTTMMDEAQKKN
jgi:hypothetical protein